MSKNKVVKKISFLFLLSVSVLFFSSALAQENSSTVQTNSATSISGHQATLNGYVPKFGYGATTLAWFQWGTSNTYGNETPRKTLNDAESINYALLNLLPNTTYHFRTVAQPSSGSVAYGQDMTFQTTNSDVITGQNLIFDKKVINLTSKNLTWQKSVNGNPGDLLAFVIVVQPQQQALTDIVIKDSLPSNLIYAGNLTVNSSLNYSGNLNDGISAETLPIGQILIVSYQARVASAQNFSYGTTTLDNIATLKSNELEDQNQKASVIVNYSLTMGATYVPTGSNNNFAEQIFLPIALLLTCLWLFFTGRMERTILAIKKRLA